MTHDPLTQLVTSKAYGIFFEELGKHLKKAHQFFFSETPPSPEQCREASASFHTIKGGSGFFALHDIAKISGELERILENKDLHYAAEAARIRNLVETLGTLASKLPPPKTAV